MDNGSNYSSQRKRLSDVLNGGADTLRTAWDDTAAAADLAPLPAGTYVARVAAGELSSARSGTPGYKLKFRVLEGPHAGRHLWHDVWLTPAALPMAKRDLGKLGVKTMDQLERPLPPGIRCQVLVALRRGDDGREHNRVRSFEVIGVDGVADDDFPPPAAGAAATPPSPDKPTTGGAAAVAAATECATSTASPANRSNGQLELNPDADKSLRPWEVNK